MSEWRSDVAAVEFDVEAYGDLFERSYRAMLSASASLADTLGGGLPPGAVANALTAAALRVAVLSALGTGAGLIDLVEMLVAEFGALSEVVETMPSSPGSLH